MRHGVGMIVLSGLVLAGGNFFAHAALSAGAGAQSPFSIATWESDSGLPQSSVLAMTQTRDGYLWLGTLEGLARFDGIQFVVLDENTTPALPSGKITFLFEDSRERLWIGTEGAGVAVLEDGKVTRVPQLNFEGADRRLMAACEDDQGALWLADATGALFRYQGDVLSPFVLSSTTQEESAFRLLFKESSGPVWVGTNRRQCAIGQIALEGALELPVAKEIPAANLDYLCASKRGGFWRLANGRVQHWNGEGPDLDFGFYPWGSATVSAAVEDLKGNLVVGTLGTGLYWYDARGKVTRLSVEEGLSHNYILSLLVDREGNLWVGTDGGGLNRIRRKVVSVLEATREMVVQSVAPDAQGGLWIGANSGGVSYWHNGELKHYMGIFSTRAVFVDRDQQVWASFRSSGALPGGLFQFQNQNNRFLRVAIEGDANPTVQAFYQDQQGHLWLGTQSGLVRQDGQQWRRFTVQDGLSSDSVSALAEGGDGALWIGTEGGGLNRFHDGRFTVYRRSNDGLPSDNISALWMDAEDVLWIGTSSGLARFKDGAWTRYTKKDGLISNSIGYLLDDGQGDMWIGSRAGLMRVAKQALNAFAGGSTNFMAIRGYGNADGLLTSECSTGGQPGPARGPGDFLWFPTIKGLAYVNRSQLQRNAIAPPVMILSVVVEGESLQPNALRMDTSQPVVLSRGQERLEIHYASLNLGLPERARFKYRLEGHEANWTEEASSRVARYPKLPPGNYQFRVTACNEDGVWNEEVATLAIQVLPPLWKTWWFRTGIVLALSVLGVAVIYRISTRRLRQEVLAFKQQEGIEKERARIARDIHDQLGASLTQVALLGELVESDKNLPDEVEAHARQISQTARDTTRTLDEIVWTVNPSHDTLEALINYVCRYAQEYLALANVRYRLEVPTGLPVIHILPEVRHQVFMTAKEAVTNVVRHAQATSAWLRLRLHLKSFDLEIADDGRGMAAMNEERLATRNGLRNMRHRMETIGGTFFMGPAPEGGLLVRLTVPVRHG